MSSKFYRSYPAGEVLRPRKSITIVLLFAADSNLQRWILALFFFLLQLSI